MVEDVVKTEVAGRDDLKSILSATSLVMKLNGLVSLAGLSLFARGLLVLLLLNATAGVLSAINSVLVGVRTLLRLPPWFSDGVEIGEAAALTVDRMLDRPVLLLDTSGGWTVGLASSLKAVNESFFSVFIVPNV